jgi:hypothetical protein
MLTAAAAGASLRGYQIVVPVAGGRTFPASIRPLRPFPSSEGQDARHEGVRLVLPLRLARRALNIAVGPGELLGIGRSVPDRRIRHAPAPSRSHKMPRSSQSASLRLSVALGPSGIVLRRVGA